MTCRGTTPNYAALTPLRFLERGALIHPARAFVVHGPVRYTWADTYSCCHRLASALTRRSVGHGSTVRPPSFPAPLLCLPIRWLSRCSIYLNSTSNLDG